MADSIWGTFMVKNIVLILWEMILLKKIEECEFLTL